VQPNISEGRTTDWAGLMRELGPSLAERSVQCDASDGFAAENFAELKARGVLAAGIPAELGGGGASYPELCEMLRVLSRYCGSTALTLSMHTHSLATIVWRWRRDPGRFENFLRRVAEQRLQLVTSGASDWLDGSGSAVRTEGGWRVSGRKIFASGSPSGDLLMTTAVDTSRRDVLHFALPLKAQGVAVIDNWRALGMRGTGSGDVVIDDVFVPDEAISLQRSTGKWVEPLHLAHTTALPLVFACYLGIAEELRGRVVVTLAKRTEDNTVYGLVGDMEVELASARMAHRDMVDRRPRWNPGHRRQTASLLTALSLAAAFFAWRT